MGAPLIGALRVSLSAETASFEAGMKRAQRTAASSSAGIAKSLGTVKAGLAALAVGLSVGLFTRAIGNALEYAGSLAETAQQLGVTAKQLQVYRFAAGQVGVSQEQLEIGLKKLNTSLGQAKLGADGPKKAFEALSKIIGKDIVAASKQGGDALPLVADALSKVADRSKRAASETALMGKSGSALDNLLAGGSRALNQLAEAAEKLGIVLSDEQIRHADDAADKLRALKTVLSANIAGVVADNAQSIVTLAGALTSLTASIVRFMSSNPTGAVAILGALAGSRFGVAGALIGGAAGAIGGANLNKTMRDSSTDIAIRKQEFLKASAALKFQQDEYKKLTPQYKKLHGDNTPQAKALVSAYVEFQRQRQLIGGAIAGSKIRPVPGPTGDISDFLAGDKKAKADHSAEEALTRQHQFDQDLSRANIDILNAKKDLAHDYVEQTAIAIQIKDAEKAAYEEELQYQVALNKVTKGKQGLSQAQADQLKAAYDSKDALERQAILDEQEAKRKEDFNQLTNTYFDVRKDVLQAELATAETAQEQRDIQLRLLDLSYRQEKARLEAVLADEKAIFAAKEDARQRLENLNKTRPFDTQAVIQNTRGPMEDYLASLPTTAAKANEALERLEVQGFDGLIDSVLALSDGMHSATESLLNTLKQFLLGIAKLELQRLLGGALENSGGILGALKGLFGGSSWLSSAGDTSASLSITDLPSFASGGSGIFRGIRGIDRNLLSLNGMPIARVSYGERFSFGNDNGPSGSGEWARGNTVMNIYTPDADSFKRSQGQITRAWQRRLR